MKRFWIFKCFKFVLFGAAAVLFFGWVTMSLWNWLIPALFKGPIITFLQALGILLLAKILFGFGGRRWGGGGCSCGQGGYGRHGYWKEKMRQKMEGMSPEEREKLRQKLSRCGWDPTTDEKSVEGK